MLWKDFDKVKLLKKNLLSNDVLAKPTVRDWGEHKILEGLCSKTVPQMYKLSFHLKNKLKLEVAYDAMQVAGLCKRVHGEIQPKDPNPNTQASPYITILVNERL